MNKYMIGLDFNTKSNRAVSVKITNWEFYYKTSNSYSLSKPILSLWSDKSLL
jgi:ribulose kinase